MADNSLQLHKKKTEKTTYKISMYVYYCLPVTAFWKFYKANQLCHTPVTLQ